MNRVSDKNYECDMLEDVSRIRSNFTCVTVVRYLCTQKLRTFYKGNTMTTCKRLKYALSSMRISLHRKDYVTFIHVIQLKGTVVHQTR